MMNDPQQYADLKEAIRAQAFVTAKSGVRIVQAENGASGAWLFDFRALLLQPKWLNRYAEIFWERYEGHYPFQVCGMETAGIPLVAAIVMKSVERGTPVNGFFIRKSRKREGLMRQIEGTLDKTPVIVVDDLINSGQSIDKTLRVLEEAGTRVSDTFALLSFRDGEAYATITGRGIRLATLFTLKDFDLPLLASRRPEVPQDAFDVLWRFQQGEPSFHFVVPKSAPAIDSKRLYFGNDSGMFFALDQSDGSIAWQFETGKHPEGKGIFSSPALSGDSVYFGAYDGNVYALSRETGERRWIYADADWIGSSPVVAPKLGLLFIGLEFGLFRKRGGIAALSLKDGRLVWQYTTTEHTHGSPLYIEEEGMVVIGSNDGVLYAYGAQTGEELWRYQTGGHIKYSCAYDPARRLIFFGSMDGKLYALDPGGAPVYARETGAGIYSTPLVHDDTVYVASLDKNLYAIDLNTWKDRWVYETRGRIFASPTIADGSLWIGSNDGKLYELDPKTGAKRHFFQFTERIVNKIAYNAETRRFFVPTVANEIYCIKKKAVHHE